MKFTEGNIDVGSFWYTNLWVPAPLHPRLLWFAFVCLELRSPPPFTTKTRSGPQRVRMSSGERPIGAAKGTQSDPEALCQPPPPFPLC